MTRIDTETRAPRHEHDAPRRAFGALAGLTALAIVLQGLWAGLFIREGKDFDESSAQSTMVTVHDWGARTAIVLALIALVFALARLRPRRDLVIGTAALFVLLMLEAYLGGEIGEEPGWTSLHVPLAMALVALAVWLPLRARRGA